MAPWSPGNSRFLPAQFWIYLGLFEECEIDRRVHRDGRGYLRDFHPGFDEELIEIGPYESIFGDQP
jgi:hypothetical protein